MLIVYNSKIMISDCTNPVAPANGIISASEGLAVNSTATISCRPGFNLTGLSTIHCLENTSWSESQASCVPIGMMFRCHDPIHDCAHYEILNTVK